MDSIKINIAGDLYLGRRLELLAQTNPEMLIDNEVLSVFENADFNIVNLESALTDADEKYKISKTGPNIKASPQTIGLIDLLKINLVTLANNHIFDFGEKGLSDTLEICRLHNISTVGAGLSLHEAMQPFFTTIGDIRLCVINIAENEWANANEKHGGANPMNFPPNIRILHKAREMADIVILIIHGGTEHSYYPSPRMVDQNRLFAEEGASIVICHHAHCVSGYEIHNNVPIFYGLGNFLFDSKTTFEGWFEGAFLSLDIKQNKQFTWKLNPYWQCKSHLKIEFPDDTFKKEIEKKMEAISQIIADPQKLREKFAALVDSRYDYILSIFSTSYIVKFKFLRNIISKVGLERFFIRNDQIKRILNSTRCESLSDVAFGVLNKYLKN